MIIVHIDAAFDPNKHSAGLAFTYNHEGQQVQHTHYIESVYDNHHAEFLALGFALEQLVANQLQHHTILICSDSKIVVQTIEKAFVKGEIYRQAYQQLTPLLKSCPMIFLKWIPEKENQYTDKLAKACLQRAK